MAIRFKLAGFILVSIFIFYCSEPKLINPNHPGTTEYISNTSTDLNKVMLEKRPEGIMISILGSEEGIDEWILHPYYHVGASLVSREREIAISLSEEGAYSQLDSLAEWGETIVYVSFAKNAAGRSRGIDTVSIDYQFIKPVCKYTAETSPDSNKFEIIVIPDSSDKMLVTSLRVQPIAPRLKVEVDDYTPYIDTIGVSISGFNWPDSFEYSLQFMGGDRISEDYGGEFNILPPSFDGTCRFLGVKGINLHLLPNTNEGRLNLTGEDSVRVNWELPDRYTLRVDESDTISFSQTSISVGRDSIAIEDWSNDFIDNITLQGYSTLWSKSFEDTVAVAIPLPEEISEMAYIVSQASSSVPGFYMDIYEVSYTKATQWLGTLNTDSLLDTIQASYADILAEFSGTLIPAIAIDKSILANLDGSRSLPTIEQWRFAGSGNREGYGLPLEGYSYVEPEICNYSNSGDNFEESHPFLQLVPIDFFSADPDREEDLYTVFGNVPAVVASPYGIYQMCGNMAEWVITDDLIDTVLVGGSFWSTLDDSLFYVESSHAPFEGESAREDWGFRTVLNDVDRPPYFLNDIKLR